MSGLNRTSGLKSRFSMERLEDRQMMAGDVAAYMQNGNLYINEAAGQAGSANAVQVSQLTNGMVRVQGYGNQAGGQTLVNGQAFQDFYVPIYSNQVGHLVVALGAGNDNVAIGQSHVVTRFNTISINTASPNANDANDSDWVTFNRVNALGGSNVYTGAGADYVTVWNSTWNNSLPGYLTVNTGEGADYVSFYGVTTKDAADIRTGNGNDYIAVSLSTIGDGNGVDYLNVFAGAGADTIKFNAGTLSSNYVRGHLNVYAYDNIAENDADVVDIRSTYVNRFINASLGAGDDQLNMLGVWAGNDILISGDSGKDAAKLTDVRASDDLWAYLGEGDDTLYMEYVGADEMVLDGEGGYDSVQRWNNAYVRDLALRNWESSNGVRYYSYYSSKSMTPVSKFGYATVLSRG